MKAKTINKVIKNKMSKWIESIDDKVLKEKLKKDIIVTGGCIPSMLLREPVNDFDVYLATKKTALMVSEYYLQKFIELNAENFKKPKDGHPKLSAYISEGENDRDRIKIVIQSSGLLSASKKEGYRYFELEDPDNASDYIDDAVEAINDTESEDKSKFEPKFITENAITLSDKIQIIIRFFGNPEEIHENYDFVHCTNYWTFKEGLVLKAEALECILAKELRYSGSLYPFCSIVRTRKFIRREWTCNAGQYLKMCFQVSKLDLEDPEVLRDQLVGVDIAYFMEIIGLLQEKMEKDNEGKSEADKRKRIDSTYLMEIIDRIF